MITRLEIDGFKSFAAFAVDVPVFVAVVGPNASGKSNIFDALSLLSRLVSMPVAEALSHGRGEPEEQFRRRGDGSRVDTMTLSVELLLNTSVRDAFGTAERLPHTRIRYEVEVSLREDEIGVRRPVIVRESAKPIPKKDDRWAAAVSEDFAEAHLVYEASQWKVLATEKNHGRPVFSLKGRRGANPQGRNSLIPAEMAVSSVLSSVTTALEFPLLFAVRQEIQGWRFLQLEPSALRLPAPAGIAGDHLSSSGGNLAWVLELIRRSSLRSGAPGLQPLASDLARVIRGFTGIEVTANDARGQWELALRSTDEGLVSARVASDGTLRLLALLAALYETNDPGVLCFEEPENGINPQRLTALLEVLRDLVSDPLSDDNDGADGLVQLFVSSHSPLLPLRMRASELLVVDSVTLLEGPYGASRATRARRVLSEDEQLPLEGAEDWAPLPAEVQMLLPGITRSDAERLVTLA